MQISSQQPRQAQPRSARPARVSSSENNEDIFVSETSSGLLGRAKELAGRALSGLSRSKLPLYKEEEEGPFGAKIERLEFHDEARNRHIPLVVYHPENKEQLEKSPVVVFSHGLAGNEYTYRYFGKHLASHGYTVLQPTHVGSSTSSFVKHPGLNIFSRQELVDRGKDVSFALDLLEQGKLPEVGDKVDLENVALAGHSFGALTAQAMAGVTVTDGKGNEVPVEDDRFDAYIAMSPYGDSPPTRILGMQPETYDKIEKPLLTISGEYDWFMTGIKGPRVHRDTFQGASSVHKYHLEIDKALHVSFAQVFGLVGITAAMTRSTSLAFLDAHLQGDAAAQDYLLEDLTEVARSHNSDAFIGSRSN
ncbi:MAG: alpha/beta fold hydrolase [Vulcanimicrobiota bacterium]